MKPEWKKIIAVIVIVVLFGIPAIIAFNYISLALILKNYTNTIRDITGINEYIIQAITALLIVPFIWGATSIFSFKKQRRRTGIIILISMYIMYNLCLFIFTKESNFSFSDGKSLKWYALTPEGVKYFDGPGIDPVYGITLKPVTPNIVRNLKLIQSADFKPIDPSNTTFFNPITGDAQVWYYKYQDNTFDFFDKPGFHPVTGEALKPITKEIYELWKNSQKTYNKESGINKESGGNISNPKNNHVNTKFEKTNMLTDINSAINGGVHITGDGTNAVIVIKSEEFTTNDYNFTELLKVSNVNIIDSYFNNNFISKGYFEAIYDGDVSILVKSSVFHDIKYLVLGKINYSYRKTASVDKDLVSCDLTLRYEIINKNGLINSSSISVIGAGFTEDYSLKNAKEKLADKYSKILTEKF